MSKASKRQSKLGWIVGGIWLVVALLAGGMLILLGGASQNSTPQVLAAVEDTQPATLQGTPTDTQAPVLADRPQATVELSPTPAMIPTRTPGPSPTPIVFPTIRPTNNALWEGPIVIGYSVQNRPLEVWRFGKGPSRYLVVAGIHGGYELNTIELADQLIAFFSKKPDAVPRDATLFILRSLNPDGEALPHKKEGRANANQVDLNRSFPVGWSPTWSRDGCWDLLELNAGAHPASEPETIALMAFVLENPVIAVISYHSAAPGFYPAGEPLDPNSIAMSKYLSKVTGYPYPAYKTGCYMTGSLVDWTLSTGAAGADVELSTHWDTEFDLNLNLVLALLRWTPPED
jgi:Zinc carboxypeptidase